MKVKLVYRNYKPLHDAYRSLKTDPPTGVQYTIPEPKSNLKKFFPIYKKFGDNFLVKKLIQLVSPFLFRTSDNFDQYDLIHYLQILPNKAPNKPFIIDFEHATALANFVRYDENIKRRILRIVKDDNCKGLIAMSQAAANSLKDYIGEKEYKRIESQLDVIYPAIPDYYEEYKDKIDHSIVKDNENLKLLFVGNDIYRKGLHELLEAFVQLRQIHVNIELYIVSNAPEDLKHKYNDKNIHYLEPKFSKEQIITQLFLPCDIFVMPTHCDTFGMVYLEALSTRTPVISTAQFAVKEMIEDQKTGLFVESNKLFLDSCKYPDKKQLYESYANEEIEQILVKDLIAHISQILDKKNLFAKMKERANKNFRPGEKFSIKQRNEQLLSIYKKALK